ncbi:MAG TPA: hypothetical protein VFN29_09155 [Chiayiivirga sp.]|nr:hypothetical protein [Chiayiivirga sp.]
MNARAWIAALLCLLMAACAPARETATPASPSKASPSTTDATAPTATGDGRLAGDAHAPRANPDAPDTKDAAIGTGTRGTVDYSCRTDADCSVKDVGNCCGYYPACVNVDSPTFPEQVKAECAASGKSGVCGFPSISACQCVEGRCAAVNGPGLATDSLK